jgi:WD40 repeat protein
VWDLETGQCLHVLGGHTGEVLAVEVTPDGQKAVSASKDHTLKVWNLESGQRLCNLFWGHRNSVSGVSVTPDGLRAVSASHDETLMVWDLQSGQCLRTLGGYGAWRSLGGHSALVEGVRITPDGRRAVSASADKTLRVWDVESGQCLSVLEGHTGEVLAVEVTPDGRRAVSASRDQTLRVWDLARGQCLHTFEGHRYVCGVRVTPDGRRAVASSDDKTLRVWDLEGSKCLAIFQATSRIMSVACLVSLVLAGTGTGEILRLELKGITFAPAILTVTHRIRASRSARGCHVANCCCCGMVFTPDPEIVAAIVHLSSRLSRRKSPCLDLPASAFADPQLLGRCPHCRAALKFNPFFVEV